MHKSTESPTLSILLAAPRTIDRAGLCQVIEAELNGATVHVCSSGSEAISALRVRDPDVVILDTNLAEPGPIELLRRMIRYKSAPEIIALVPHPDGPLPGAMLDAGARGVVSRRCDSSELIRAVQHASSGKTHLSSEIARALALTSRKRSPHPLSTLSPRELSVLLLVSQGHDLHRISDSLSVSRKTVSTYRGRVLRKLGAHSDVELTHWSLRFGLIELGSFSG